MVTLPEERQGMETAPASAGPAGGAPVVAFDFDGTLTTVDSFTAFLRWRIGPLAYYAGFARLAPAAIRYLFDRDKGRIKSAAIRVYLHGLKQQVLEQQASAFASAVAPLILRPDALETWRRHRADGATMVIVSASPKCVVAPFARALGADLLIASQIAFDKHGRVGGGLAGRNCRGAEKVDRLKAAFGPDVRPIAAYGDTDGDREMLELAEQGYMRAFVEAPGSRRGAL